VLADSYTLPMSAHTAPDHYVRVVGSPSCSSSEWRLGPCRANRGGAVPRNARGTGRGGRETGRRTRREEREVQQCYGERPSTSFTAEVGLALVAGLCSVSSLQCKAWASGPASPLCLSSPSHRLQTHRGLSHSRLRLPPSALAQCAPSLSSASLRLLDGSSELSSVHQRRRQPRLPQSQSTPAERSLASPRGRLHLCAATHWDGGRPPLFTPSLCTSPFSP